MQTITTKYHGPTNTRCSRVSATSTGGARVYATNHLADEDAHNKAALALMERLNWHGTMLRGGVKGGFVYVFFDNVSNDDMIHRKYISCDDK